MYQHNRPTLDEISAGIKQSPIRIVANMGPHLMFVSDSQDTQPIKDSISGAADYDSFFVAISDGDYTEVWGMVGIVPYRSKLVSRLV